PSAAGGDLPGLSPALSADHDDDTRSDVRRAAPGARHRRRLGAAPAARHFDCRRAHRKPGADALHHAGDLSLSRPLPPVEPWALAAAAPGIRHRRRHSGAWRMKPTIALSTVALLAACTVGPDYHRPPAPVPAAYKERGWKAATPEDTTSRGPWWSIYNDPVLDGLERQVDVSNQNLKASEAAYRQARAVVAEGEAGLFPTLTVTGAGTHSGQGGGGPTITSTGGTFSTSRSNSTISLTADASWSVDLWGRIRRTVESDVANAQASAADLANARLSAQGQLATLYFELRAADEQKRLLDASVEAFTQSLQITRNQYTVGVAAPTDVVTAETQLEQTRSQAIAVGVQRAQFEHAIATLIGKPASDFSLAVALMPSGVPIEPPGVPSALLERRPDIAAAERLMASSNAQIGVAVAAFYPDLTLTGSYGFASSGLSKLFRASNSLWSVGGQVVQTVFDA